MHEVPFRSPKEEYTVKNRFLTCLTIGSVVSTCLFAPARADVVPEAVQAAEVVTPTPKETPLVADSIDDEEDATPEGKPVSKEDEDAKKNARKGKWVNIALAVSAVVVAVVACILVSENNGSHH